MKWRWLSEVDVVLGISLVFLWSLSTLTLLSFVVSPGVSLPEGTIFKHLLGIGLGGGLIGVVWGTDYRFFRGLARPLYLITLGVLVLVLILGETVQGSSRWIAIFGLSFQPVELAKIVVIILMAKYMATYQTHLSSFAYIIYSAIPVILLSGLTFLQPDLGSAVMLIAVWFGMLLMARIRWVHLLYLVGFAFLVGGILWMGYLEPYQKERVYTFFNPYSAPLESGYNTIQAIQAVKRGGILGQGLSQGENLRYVPEVHTDFVFAGFAQQWGFVGVSVYFVLIGTIGVRLCILAFKAQDSFAQMVVGGTLALFIFQTGVHVGMNLGLLPITGLTLPFMSYGGSSMIAFSFLFGLVFSIHRQLFRTGSHISAVGDNMELG